MSSEERKIVKSYNNIWKLNRTFYSIGGVSLPTPVSINFAGYFVLAIVIMYFIGFMFPSIIRYVLIPIAFAWIFDAKLLDGKSPFQFAGSMATHLYLVYGKGSKINRYKHYQAENPKIDSKIAFRTHERPTE